MTELTTVTAWLNKHKFGEIQSASSLTGGSISITRLLSFSDGRTLVVKQLESAAENFFTAEATSLEALASACGLRIPEVIHADKHFILLENLGAGVPQADFWTRLGQGLAELHGTTHGQFGFHCDTYCGPTPQANPLTDDGFTFFASQRLLPLARSAEQSGLLDCDDRRAIEGIAARLADLIPQQPAVLIHGDLWSGNVHVDSAGQPALIDPACYFGWAEAELAMTMLFGRFDPAFYQVYESESGVASDWRDRAPLYNLYHLLNHLLLFGTAYYPQVSTIIRRYASD